MGPFERQMQENAINGQASGLSSTPRWAIELDRKLDKIINLLEKSPSPCRHTLEEKEGKAD